MSKSKYINECECGGGWNDKYSMNRHYNSCKHQKYEIIKYGKIGEIELKTPKKMYTKICKCGGGWNGGHKKRHLESVKHQLYIMNK